MGQDLPGIDVLATSDHKFLLNAGRGVGYCYLSNAAQDRFRPVAPGWKAGRAPLASFFGPDMDLSPTASRFDNSIGWLAALGDEAAMAAFDDFGIDTVFARNRELTDLLAGSIADVGWRPITLPAANRSTIVSVPLDDRDPAVVLAALRERSVVAAARDGHLRLSVHFYCHEDDIERLVRALARL